MIVKLWRCNYMNISKVKWAIRYCLYSMISGSSMPGYIGKPVYISNLKKFKTGKRVRIYPGLRSETVCDNASIEIGENTSIGQNCHLVSYNSALKIGKNVTISGNVFISNCDHHYQEIGKHILEQEVVEQDTTIDDGCFIGYGAVILAGTHLGKQCIVGSNSVVRGDYSDYSVIVGSPSRVIKHYDSQRKEWVKE